jgi:putative peptidoglycan lipid II flippase
MRVLGHVGIALATALSAWVNCALLARGLVARGALRADARLRRATLGATAASLFMAAALVLASHAGLSPLAQATGLARWAALGALIGIGGLVYAVAGAAFGAVRPRALLALLRRPRH